MLPALRALQDADRRADAELRARGLERQAEWASAADRAQREALEAAMDEVDQQLDAHRAARRSRDLPLGTPYFGRLVLKEGARRSEVLLGKIGVTDGGLRIVDWRNAPISRLYYDYAEGDAFAEEIAGREREGEVAVRRRVDIHEGVLIEVEAAGVVLRRRPDGTFAAPAAVREREDHRLPDIVSLITAEQFGIISQAHAGVVLLRGRAGSGKTTVALHRVAYLHYHAPDRFRADRILVVMFNKALQTYIGRVLPELGVDGVLAETFHGWAGRMLRAAGVRQPFKGGIPAAVARLKRHPAISALLEAYVDGLAEQTSTWLDANLPKDHSDKSVGARDRLWRKMRDRWRDHARDVWQLFDDDALCRRILAPELHRTLDAARQHAARCREEGVLDWEDAALVLRMGQLKHVRDPQVPCTWAHAYAHVVIDEAQDLSTVEIEVLVDAADRSRSVTIAGDPAQKILADAQFEGFEALVTRLSGHVAVRLDALAVGHRSTREIMALAIRALGKTDDPILATARPGEPVTWVGSVEEVAEAIRAFRADHPWSLVAVLAKRKNVADEWATALGALLPDVRRAARDGFVFDPGVVVSNVHQVKGLEFDGVVLVDPADYGARDRQLLHVAITRAADRLWVAAPRGPGPLLPPST